MMKSLEWKDESLVILDQTKLPLKEEYILAETHTRVAQAIRDMEVRGAPAIGIAAAYGVVLGFRAYGGAPAQLGEYMQGVFHMLEETRPTAVNLFWALRRMENKFWELQGREEGDIGEGLLTEACHMAAEDESANRKIGQWGNELIPAWANILTHCNAGALATVAYGTALGVVRTAWESGKKIHVYAGETRPCLQGARLTAWELKQDKIPVTLIADSMAGYLMQQKKIDLVLVGADRVAANGDVANKIGTYSLAVLAAAHEIPFYVAAPTTSIDLKICTGKDIPVEERNGDEIRVLGGQTVAPAQIPVYNPAFDITPSKYITGIITEKGVIAPPYSTNLLKMMVQAD